LPLQPGHLPGRARFLAPLRFGTVGITGINPTGAAAPFGGRQKSGLGTRPRRNQRLPLCKAGVSGDCLLDQTGGHGRPQDRSHLKSEAFICCHYLTTLILNSFSLEIPFFTVMVQLPGLSTLFLSTSRYRIELSILWGVKRRGIPSCLYSTRMSS